MLLKRQQSLNCTEIMGKFNWYFVLHISQVYLADKGLKRWDNIWGGITLITYDLIILVKHVNCQHWSITAPLCSLTMTSMPRPIDPITMLSSSNWPGSRHPWYAVWVLYQRAFSVAALRLWNEHDELSLEIIYRKKLRKYFWFLVRLFLLKSSVVQLAQTTNANGFQNYESDYEYVCRASELESPGI